MVSQRAKIVLLASLVLAAAGCVLDDSPGATAGGEGTNTVEQSVFLQPIFVLGGIEELPLDVRLDELHLGVGAIFLDRVEAGEDGIAYANQTPFQLHFDIRDGGLVAFAPPMTLPQGGTYQISVQIEPQDLVVGGVEDVVARAVSETKRASLIVSGTFIRDRYSADEEDDDDDDDDDRAAEPAPLPWIPDVERTGRLTRETERIPFVYSSQRTVRFVLDDIDLVSGEQTDLVLELQVGSWIEETVKPALRQVIGAGNEVGEFSNGNVETIDVVVEENVDQVQQGNGIDALIGGIDVYLLD